jgi:hypothetical protein
MSAKTKGISILRYTFPLATLLSGFLAGTTVDRFAIQFPAWNEVGSSAWAIYSRHADLGNGVFVYSIEAIGGTLLLVLSSLVVIRNKISKAISVPIHIASVLGIIGLIFTIFAAPWILKLRGSGDDPKTLQNIFDHFYFWSVFRAIAQIASFVSCIWALGRILTRKEI